MITEEEIIETAINAARMAQKQSLILQEIAEKFTKQRQEADEDQLLSMQTHTVPKLSLGDYSVMFDAERQAINSAISGHEKVCAMYRQISEILSKQEAAKIKKEQDDKYYQIIRGLQA